MSRRKKSLRKNRTGVQKNQKAEVFEKIFILISQLSEPAQVILIIGILLLLAWIASNPDVLRGIIRALQFWFAIISNFQLRYQT